MRFYANICEAPLCTENASNGSLPHCRFCSICPVHTKDRKTLLSLKRNTAIVIICVCACYWMTSLCSKRFLSLFILIRRDCFFKCSSSKQRFQICGVFFSRTSQVFSILFERKMFVQYVIAIRPPSPSARLCFLFSPPFLFIERIFSFCRNVRTLCYMGKKDSRLFVLVPCGKAGIC